MKYGMFLIALLLSAGATANENVLLLKAKDSAGYYVVVPSCEINKHRVKRVWVKDLEKDAPIRITEGEREKRCIVVEVHKTT